MESGVADEITPNGSRTESFQLDYFLSGRTIQVKMGQNYQTNM